MVGAVAILYLARDTFIPLAFAITLALILAPPVGWLQKCGLHRAPAALLVMVLALSGMGGVSYVIFNQLVEVVNELPTYRETITRKVLIFRKPGDNAIGRAAETVKELGKELAGTPTPASSPTTALGPAAKSRTASPVAVQMVEKPENIFAYLRDLIQPFAAPVAMFGIVVVFTIFLLIEQVDVRNRLFKLAGVSRLNLMTQAVDDATRRVSRYLMLQFAVNLAFGVAIWLGLSAIGLPYAALWGGVAALLRIVPYVGSAIAGLLPLLLCLAVFDGWHEALLVFLLFASMELVTANFLEPWLYGAHTGISSLALLLTTIFWATLWGPPGLILSTPLTVCAVVLGRHIKHLSFLHVLLGDETSLPADAHLYQRLLAMDDHEARSVSLEFRKDKSLVEVYDGLLLPAVVMAESDRHKGALTPEREEFFFMSVREMLAEWSERPGEQTPPAPSQPASQGRILCLPAHDEADELAAAMLAQLLEQSNRASISFPLGAEMQPMIDLIKPTQADLVCISSVPPFAFTSARNLCGQLRAQFPKTRILIGVWGFSGDAERAAQRFRPSLPDKFVTSLAAALEYVESEAGQ